MLLDPLICLGAPGAGSGGFRKLHWPAPRGVQFMNRPHRD